MCNECVKTLVGVEVMTMIDRDSGGYAFRTPPPTLLMDNLLFFSTHRYRHNSSRRQYWLEF